MASPEFEGNAPYPAPPPDAEPDEIPGNDLDERHDDVVKEIPDASE